MRRNDFFKYLLLSGGNPASRAELETETLPYMFYTQPKTLKNYRIYGNTVNGESVGDRTGNLFDGEWTQGGVGNTGNLNDENQKRIKTIVSVIPSQTYTIRTNLSIRMIFAYNDTTEESGIVSKLLDIMNGVEFATITIPNNANLIAVALMSSDNSNITPSDVEWTMLNSGSTALPYEPYGYKIPVIVNEQTTNIYLDEPLANSNDIADYIDYKLQKRFNADGTSEDVALPEIAVFDNENEISFDTTIQPSKVYLKGGISENEVTISQQAQNLQTMRSLQPLSLDGDDFQLDVMPTESDLQLDVIIPTANLNRIEDDEDAE